MRYDRQDFIQLNSLGGEVRRQARYPWFPVQPIWPPVLRPDFELMNTLEHVRPGDGYKPKFQIMAKCTVNGENEEPLWTYLKNAIPAPEDDRGGTGSDFIYAIQPNTMPIQWSPPSAAQTSPGTSKSS